MFSDGGQVTTLPGTKEAFTSEKYKEDLGNTYPRITLFLCPLEDASVSESEQNCWADLESEIDDWLNDVDIADTFPVDISQDSAVTTSTTKACATTSGSVTSTTSTGVVQSSFFLVNVFMFSILTQCFDFILQTRISVKNLYNNYELFGF